jgi:hypothetical protein
MRHRADVPDVAENIARVWREQSREFAIESPCARQRIFIDIPGTLVEEERDRWNVGLGAIEADVALALLLGIVEGMRVEKRPDELAADIFETKFEMGVLVDGVMAAIKGGGADVKALLVSDFFVGDEMGGIAGARGGDGRVEGMQEGVAQRRKRTNV